MPSAALALLLLAQGAWSLPKGIVLEGKESYDGKALPYRLTLEGSKTSFTSYRGIGFWPGGVSRTEINTGKGVFTWIEGQRRVLALAAFSQPDVPIWIAPIRFPKEALVQNKVPDWTVSASQTVAGRDCFVLTPKTGSKQKLWVDKESGLTLKQQDADERGKVFYERATQSAQAGPAPAGIFEAPQGITPILGIPDPVILTAKRLDRPYSDYTFDLKTIKRVSKLTPETWVSQVPEFPGFTYVGTEFRESQGKPVASIWPSNRLGAPEIEPGGLPPGWSVSGELNGDGTMTLNFDTGIGSGPKMIVSAPQGDGSSIFGMTITFDDEPPVNIAYTTFQGPDGAIVIAPGGNVDEARQRRELRRLELSKANAVVQSDFIDVATGNTVSFLQVRGRDWKSVALLPTLPKAEGTTVKTYTIPGWFPLNLAVWQKNATTYVLASSTLKKERLVELAGGVKLLN